MANVRHVAVAPPPARNIPVWTWLATKNHGYFVAGYSILIILGLWTIFPVYWQVTTSIRADADLYAPVVSLLPRSLTFDHYNTVLFGPKTQFWIQFGNSLIVALATAGIAVGFGAMAGYALTRLRFFGRSGLARVVVFTYLAPATILFIPLYAMMNSAGLRDSLTGLILAHLTFSVPFATWILMGYFRTVPIELEEAALVDGAGRFTLLWRIILPLAAPAVVVCCVFAFTASWRELIYALVLVQARDKMTAPIGLTSYVIGDNFFWGQMMAAATLMSLPPLILYLFGQRWVIQGWTAGAVKS